MMRAPVLFATVACLLLALGVAGESQSPHHLPLPRPVHMAECWGRGRSASSRAAVLALLSLPMVLHD